MSLANFQKCDHSSVPVSGIVLRLCGVLVTASCQHCHQRLKSFVRFKKTLVSGVPCLPFVPSQLYSFHILYIADYCHATDD
jgi:hypothetical protein